MQAQRLIEIPVNIILKGLVAHIFDHFHQQVKAQIAVFVIVVFSGLGINQGIEKGISVILFNVQVFGNWSGTFRKSGYGKWLSPISRFHLS